MRQDIDFRLIALVIIVVVGIIGLTVFYQSSAGNVVGKYKKLANKYHDLKENLNETEDLLEQCQLKSETLNLKFNETKTYQEEAQEGFNEIFTETENQLEETASTLGNTQDQLKDAKSALSTANDKVSRLEAEKENLQDKYDDIVEDAETVIAKADNVEDDITNCKNNADANTCIASVQSEYNDLKGKIDDLEDNVN